jgi:hypothetical protein
MIPEIQLKRSLPLRFVHIVFLNSSFEMEKYRKFSDSATSCNPFLPVESVRSSRRSRIGSVLLSICAAILVVIRIPILTASSLLLCLTDVLSFVPFLSDLVVIPLLRPIVSWLLLLSMGIVSSLSTKTEDFRRLQVQRPSGTPTESHATVSSFHGFTDVLVHAASTKPSCFVFQSLDGGYKSYRTVIGSIKEACLCPVQAYLGSNLSTLKRGSVLFVSPAPTNGTGLLKLNAESLKRIVKDSRIQLSSLNYSCVGHHYPHHLTESFVNHLFKQVTRNLYCYVAVKTLPEPTVIKSDDDVARIKKLLARLADPSAAETELDPSMYLEFLSYWRETQSISYGSNKSR